MNVNARRNKLRRFNFNKYVHTDLTNFRYVKLLHFLLKSEHSLSSYEIQRGMRKSKYIHEMLTNLYLSSSGLEHLFIWDKVDSNNEDIENINKKLYRILNSI